MTTNVRFFHNAQERAARTQVFKKVKAEHRAAIVAQNLDELQYMVKMTKSLPSLRDTTKGFSQFYFALKNFVEFAEPVLELLREEYQRDHAPSSINQRITQSLNETSDVRSEDEQIYD